jgi:hypothetical protein
LVETVKLEAVAVEEDATEDATEEAIEEAEVPQVP